jgi:polysaccharide export outer membrane protein
VSAARLVGLRQILVCLAASALAGCTIIPGNQSYSNRDESDVRCAGAAGRRAGPANVKIKPITAELIIDMFKARGRPSATAPAFSQGGDGGTIPRYGDQPEDRCPSTGSGRVTSFRSSSGITPS